MYIIWERCSGTVARSFCCDVRVCVFFFFRWFYHFTCIWLARRLASFVEWFACFFICYESLLDILYVSLAMRNQQRRSLALSLFFRFYLKSFIVSLVSRTHYLPLESFRQNVTTKQKPKNSRCNSENTSKHEQRTPNDTQLEMTLCQANKMERLFRVGGVAVAAATALYYFMTYIRMMKTQKSNCYSFGFSL